MISALIISFINLLDCADFSQPTLQVGWVWFCRAARRMTAGRRLLLLRPAPPLLSKNRSDHNAA
jgi:hypothetical protein